MIVNDTLEPSTLSIPELLFVLDHIGKPPIAALHRPPPAGVNPAEVRSVLGAIYDATELEKHEKVDWAGIGAVREAILRYLAWHERSIEIRRRLRGSIGHPSMYVWDSDGRAIRGGIGADSGIVRTEIMADGSRLPFAVNLRWPGGANPVSEDISDVAPWIRRAQMEGAAAKVTDDLQIERGKKFGTIGCPVCGKKEEFNPADRATFNAARARMGKHLKTSRTEIARHRLLHTKRFT
jgi:hypothetical protein